MANDAHYCLQRTEARQARCERSRYILVRVAALFQDQPG
jgi:hypothetical protein